MTRDILVAKIKDAGLSLLELSKRAGVDYCTLWRLMNKRSGVSLTTADKLCTALGVKLTLETAGTKKKG